LIDADDLENAEETPPLEIDNKENKIILQD
jgi:hypothetical protein